MQTVVRAPVGHIIGLVSDPFVPEADSLDQRREVGPGTDDDDEPDSAIRYPRGIPIEAPESDVLEQNQSVDFDEDER